MFTRTWVLVLYNNIGINYVIQMGEKKKSSDNLLRHLFIQFFLSSLITVKDNVLGVTNCWE